MRVINILIKKEFAIDFRKKSAIGGVLLFVFSSVLVLKLSFTKPDPLVWLSLFWLISLFAAFNTVLKSFTNEKNARQLYYYQIISPLQSHFSKLIYCFLNLLVINVLTFGVMALLLLQPMRVLSVFFLTLCIGAMSFAIILSFVSAVAAKADNPNLLMSVLGFHVVIPVLILLVKLSKNGLMLVDTAWYWEIFNVVGIDAILIALTIVLIPFLWKE